MSQLSANNFSNYEFTIALQEVGINGGFVKAIKRGNTLIVIYNVWDERTQKWVRASRFMSPNLLLRIKLRNTITKAKTVQFTIGTCPEMGVTTTIRDKNNNYVSGGHTVTLFHCSCPLHTRLGEINVMKAGESHDRMYKTCKHQLAFAKTYHGCMKLSDLTKLRESILNDRLVA